jgi:hypothetical protein
LLKSIALDHRLEGVEVEEMTIGRVQRASTELLDIP